MHKPLLSVKKLGCIRQERILFKNLSFDVKPHDIFHITGPNGVGKSSLLSIISGLMSVEFGSLYWGDAHTDANRFSRFEQVVYLGHKNGLNPKLSVFEQLKRFQLLLGAQNDTASFFSSVLTQLGFDSDPAFLNQCVNSLSQGQKRRLAFARVLMSTASLWILDEPFAAMDASSMENLECLIVQHAKRGGAVILTSHQPCARSTQLDLGSYACL